MTQYIVLYDTIMAVANPLWLLLERFPMSDWKHGPIGRKQYFQTLVPGSNPLRLVLELNPKP